jgi:GNAT superfamily N-acetyltransferase
MANISIRLATEADIPALHALIEASIRGLQAADYTPAQIEGAIGNALGLDTQLVRDRTYFLAESPGIPHPIACGGWSFRRTLFGSDGASVRESTPLNPATEPAKIRAIFVHPAHARRGLGTLILTHAEQAAHAAGFRSLEMGSTLTGVPLYTLRGYTPIQQIAIPLPNGATLPILKMTKTLDHEK